MLARYRNSGTAPIDSQDSLDGKKCRLKELGFNPESLRTALLEWTGGALEGIYHQAGQFPALTDGAAGAAVPSPPADLRQALAQDLDLLARLRDLTKAVHLDFSYYGTEGDYPLAPIILEPRPGVSQEQTPLEQLLLQQQEPPQPRPRPQPAASPTAAESEADVGDQDRRASGSGGWWSLEAALATPLTWAEVAASLGVAPEVAGELTPMSEWDIKEDFWRDLMADFISCMDGGANRPNVAGDDHQGPASPSNFELELEAGMGPRDNGQPETQKPVRQAVLMADAFRQLCEAVEFPRVIQVALGGDYWRWNPIPLLWLGRSRRSGAILGFATYVVWT